MGALNNRSLVILFLLELPELFYFITSYLPSRNDNEKQSNVDVKVCVQGNILFEERMIPLF